MPGRSQTRDSPKTSKCHTLSGLILGGGEGLEVNIFWQNCPPLNPYNLVPASQPAAPPYLRGAVLGAGFQHIRGPGRGKRKDNCTCRIQMQITQTCFKPSHKFSSCVEALETADAGCSWDAAQEWVSLLRVRCSRRRCSSQTPAMHRLRNPVPGMYKINKQTSVQSKEAAQRRWQSCPANTVQHLDASRASEKTR